MRCVQLRVHLDEQTKRMIRQPCLALSRDSGYQVPLAGANAVAFTAGAPVGMQLMAAILR